MAKFRMVPEDASEAAYIHELISADIAKNLPELNKDLKKLRLRLEWAERWEGIASDLREEEGLYADDPVQQPDPKPKKTASPASPAKSEPEKPKA